MIEQFKKYICSNCKGNCNKGIVIVKSNEMKFARCVDYEKRDEVQGYIRPEERIAKQSKPLMKLV